jgi:predicted ester cyclase
MSTEQNKAAIRRAYEEAFNKGNMAVLDEIMAPEYVLQGSHGLEFKGSAAFKKYIVMIRAALPDLFVTPVEILAEGDKVVHRARYRGTHTQDPHGHRGDRQ